MHPRGKLNQVVTFLFLQRLLPLGNLISYTPDDHHREILEVLKISEENKHMVGLSLYFVTFIAYSHRGR